MPNEIITQRAFSVLNVKEAKAEDGKRIIRGVATTPTPDRIGDIVDPMGVEFKNPMPLLWQHRSTQPVGTVKFDKPTKDGITFVAEMPSISEPGTLKDRIDEAWQSLQHGLVSAVSIGFRALEYAFIEATGGIHFTKTEIYELSLVTIPAQPDAVITSLKSLDSEAISLLKQFDVNAPAATGTIERPTPKSPGATGTKKAVKTVKINSVPNKQETKMKTIAEQIAAFEATRAAKSAELETLMTGTEGETLDAEGGEAADTLAAEIDSIDKHLKRLRLVEQINKGNVKPVKGDNQDDANAARGGGQDQSTTVRVKQQEKLPKGIEFARLAKAKALSYLHLQKGEMRSAADIAKQLWGENSVAYGILTKANVVAGSSVDGNWAANLVGDETSVFADFVEFLRPMTIVGKFGTNGIPSLRNVPFRVPLIGQTGGGQAYWVGEGRPKPLTAFDFSRNTLDELKVATISVVTEELLRKSAPAADGLLRDALAAAVAERIDIDFIDPAKAAVANVSPASITNGVTPIASVGGDADSIREDIRALIATFIGANNNVADAVLIMSQNTALATSMLQNPLGQSEFGGLTMNGGTLLGLPVITSQYVEPVTAGGFVILAKASDIYFADEGGVAVDVSREASLQMLDNPTNASVDATATSMVSMWQTNSVAFRAERILNWAKRRPGAVAVLSEVEWGLPASA